MNKILSIVLVCIVVFSSCKNRKNKNAQKPGAVVFEQDSTVIPSASNILDVTLKNWTYFSAKIDVEFRENDNKLKPNATIRMYKDSLIWISAGMFGIEGVRILINNDSVVMINKIEKTYTIYKNNAFKGISDIPLDVVQIQNLILGKPIYALELYSILLNNSNSLNINYNQKKFNTFHHYKREYLTIDSTTIRDNITPNYAIANYSNYTVVSSHNFPAKTFIKASNGSKIYEIDLQYSDIDFETALTFPLTIPSSYEKTK